MGYKTYLVEETEGTAVVAKAVTETNEVETNVAPDTDNGLAVLTNSVREYELIGEGFSTLAITLFRSVGFLGKEEDQEDLQELKCLLQIRK